MNTAYRHEDLEKIYEGASIMIESLHEEHDLYIPPVDDLASYVEKSTVYGSLTDLTVTHIDDQKDILLTHALPLAIATRGAARCVLHESDETEDDIAKRIIELRPVVTLMDRKLLGEVRGPNLVKRLADIAHIGFSEDTAISGNSVEQEFLDAGAIAFVHKTSSLKQLRSNILHISELVRSRILRT